MTKEEKTVINQTITLLKMIKTEIKEAEAERLLLELKNSLKTTFPVKRRG
jgi:hypothetical protein